MPDPLQKLFGSDARIKLLRLFLFNPKQSFTVPDAAARARVPERTARKEINVFSSIGMLHRTASRKVSGARYSLNDHFSYKTTLQQLLLNAPARAKDIHESIRRVGVIKLIVVAGIFVDEWEGRLDVLVVGDRIKEHRLHSQMRKLESELGRELKYTMLATEDFLYRLNMNDKLVRDIWDYPHRIVFDRLNIGLK